ncbi:MAG: dioxygenase [Planctomycetes bacterium]|nr:dioxygenase [Planctomycetota bacterium]
MPTIFLAHGAPPLLDMPDWVDELANWSRRIDEPKSILMVSAHWEQKPIALGATKTVPLVYDFYGFPDKYYQQRYEAPGAPELAKRVETVFGKDKVTRTERGLDHGAYVPLVAMYPKADVPVLQLSLPTLSPRELFALGKKLAPLRDEGVLIVGSGFLTHNLRRVDWSDDPATPQWAAEFDTWAKERLLARDVDALLDFEQKAPSANTALPTTEHYVPLLVALGAAADDTRVDFPITGFWMGSLTRRSVQFG